MSRNVAYPIGGPAIGRRVPVIRQPCGHRGRTLPELVGTTAWCGACYAATGEWVMTVSAPAPVIESTPRPESPGARQERTATACDQAAAIRRAKRDQALAALADHLRTSGQTHITRGEWNAIAGARGLTKASALTDHHGGRWADVCAAACALPRDVEAA